METAVPAPPMSPTTQMELRLLVVAGLMFGLTALLAWWVGWKELPIWTLLLVIGVPAFLGALWVGHGHGRRTRLVAGVSFALVGALITWWAWTPTPAVDRLIRDHPGQVDAVAARLLETIPSGSCRPAGQVDLGVLAQVGPWAEVCVWGRAGGAATVMELDRTRDDIQGAADFTLDRRQVIAPDGCRHHIRSGWYALVQANQQDPGDPCPFDWQFEGGP